MPPRFFDIHSHLNFSQFDEDREEIINKMKEEGIWTITVGTSLETSKESVELADLHENIFATVGIHPTDYEEKFDEKEFEEMVSNPKVVGVGECGLDYYRSPQKLADGTQIGAEEWKKKQKDLFAAQIEFAAKYNLPLMIHGRPKAGSMNAYHDILETTTMYRSGLPDYPGNLHFFVGDTAIAQKFLDLGFSISFDGPITFAKEYEEVVKYVPLERMMSETDSPFAAPAPYRGQRNNPLYVKEVYKAIAEIKSNELERVREALTSNALKLWKISV